MKDNNINIKDNTPGGTRADNPWFDPSAKYNHLGTGFLERAWGHFKTVARHKKYVAEGCFKVGLYFQGITHDLSKYSPSEFKIGIKYFDGHRSPNAVERAFNEGCSTAWLHHKGRNRHHFEYWIDFSHFPGKRVYGNRMPLKYVAEMVCDRRAACKTYQGKDYRPDAPWNYFLFSKEHLIMHRDTRIVLENCLFVMKEDGEEAAFKFIRGLLKITRGADYTAESLGLNDLTGDAGGSRYSENHG